MGWIVITVIAALVIAAGTVWFFSNDQDSGWGGIVAGGAFVVWLVITALFSVENIGARNVGVVYSFSGTIVGQRGQGTVFIPPWDHVSTTNIGVQREDFVLDTNNSAVSKDQQSIFADISLNYSVDPQHILPLYKTVGPNWKSILLDSRVLQDFKEVTSGFTAEQITTQREALRVQTKERLTTELSKYDITVVDFFVKNLSYTSSYQDSINAKNVQVQKALQAQAKVAQARAEAEQKVAQAKGTAESNVLLATAQAKSLALKGKALRDNPLILQLEAIDKLNPNAAVIICTGTGQDNCPSFLGSAITSATTGSKP